MSASEQAAEAIADSMAREAGADALRQLRIPSIGIQRYATNSGALTVQAVWTMGALCINWILEEEPITPARARELIAERIDSLGGTPHPRRLRYEAAPALPMRGKAGEASSVRLRP